MIRPCIQEMPIRKTGIAKTIDDAIQRYLNKSLESGNKNYKLKYWEKRGDKIFICFDYAGKTFGTLFEDVTIYADYEGM